MSGEIRIAEEFLDTLLRTERSTEAELRNYQAGLLTKLVHHAAANVPFYSARAQPPERIDPKSDYWLQQPFMSRRDLTENNENLRAREFPRLHGLITTAYTGGSTGPSARRDLSSLESLARFVASYRMFKSWDLDQTLALYWLRKPRAPSPSNYDRWGFPWTAKEKLGPRRSMDIALPATEQLQFMQGGGPVYANTLPSNILRLAHEASRSKPGLSIPHIVSVAEYLSPEVRQAASTAFGTRVIDVFSSAEGGVIAVECPDSGLYHIQSELLLAEIVRDDGEPCGEGETGEVVVTPLYNYATPLLRYRSGDYVERGPRCSCGRTLPTISRIVGRKQHMFVFPDGRRALPAIDRVKITEILHHDHWVLAQTGRADAELRIAGPTTRAQETRILEMTTAALQNQFQIKPRTVDALPLTSGGKRHFTLNAFEA